MYERIVMPLDGSEIGEAAIPYVQELVSKLCPDQKIDIIAINVISADRQEMSAGGGQYVAIPYSKEEMEKFKKDAMAYLRKATKGLKEKEAAVKLIVSVGDVSEEILKACDENKATLIAMATHGRATLARWAFGSVTDTILRHGNIAVLLARSHKK